MDEQYRQWAKFYAPGESAAMEIRALKARLAVTELQRDAAAGCVPVHGRLGEKSPWQWTRAVADRDG